MVSKVERIYKALGDKTRLRIINMLGEKSMCVCEITEVLKLSQSTISGHLRVLKDAELVEDEKDGLWVEYHLCRDEKFISDIVNLILDALASDPKMIEESKKASQADRNAICRK
ncbi:MAG: winged helix-turn-helix transcriptional regulator [Candidatus Aminicenantes bacterium]|nr:MAG: winged helix-turn-helix transcriptional regulator [Candidatus Aminicenantes bacterium]